MNPPTAFSYHTIEVRWTAVQLGMIELLTVPGEGFFLRSAAGRDGDVNDISTGPEVWSEWTAADLVTGLTEGKFEDAVIIWSADQPGIQSEIPFGVLEDVVSHSIDALPADLDAVNRAEAHLRTAMHIIDFEELNEHY